MLFIMQAPGGNEIWIGDGVTRRHIPNLQTFNDILYRGSIGQLKLADGGKTIVGNLDLCGKAI